MNRKSWIAGVLLFFSTSVSAQDFPAVQQLAQRRVPWLASSLVLKGIPAENGKDVFEISTPGKQVYISASSSSAAAAGLNWYLKYYCHRSMSHMGDNLAAVSLLPPVKEKVHINTTFDYRYALNYCTISYTMSFYSWKDWEHELDWMALNGVNVMLATVGTEAVWQHTLQRLGYSNEAARQFVAGPGFTAWWLMGNLEGWGGPVTQQIIDDQTALEKQILARMHDLGIAPVLQGFYGMIPVNAKEKMQLNVVAQGKWAGGFQRPDFLVPGDSNFTKISGIYYEELKKLYGSDIRFFAGDPFHEGGNSNGVDVTAAAHSIQKEMQRYFPGSTWILQGWQANPSTALLAGLDKSKVLVQELFGENTANWEQRKGYEGTPFIWCSVTNFGEKLGLYGKLQRFADETYRAAQGPYGKLLKGIGIMPEGIHNNPVIYELMMELAWHPQHVEVKDWIKSYVRSRYGTDNADMQAAWQGLIATAYSSFPQLQEGPNESVFCARPTMEDHPVSTWGTRKRNYDTQKFAAAVALFMKAAPRMKDNTTYEIDAIDFQRQVISNNGEEVYGEMVKAYHNKDLGAFKKISASFLAMMQQQDLLLSGNSHFRLDTWLKAAQHLGKTPAEKILLEKNARTQITYWGPDNPDTDLHEYANKEWSGLMRNYYIPRWKMFIAALTAQLEGKEFKQPDFFAWEKNWALTGK
ncbi:alpha-N-acetylglucosaminidase [Chitinophaga niastensis]|uniref:Alpha-N-acetylglucosaminidase n=1 Tax=Chitinophaga niastensis TaxID=536980 RepID=A0A2P8HNN5_CHINA|nr:alpha-N-acetylglucosaminidase [Chitinophaga niastensis]PSL47836.1 alpha-N-acetylglucosaminidase [Chitinophaga niastensis]